MGEEPKIKTKDKIQEIMTNHFCSTPILIFYLDLSNLIVYIQPMIEWNRKYSVGIPKIDREHKRLIAVINKAILSKEQKDGLEELKQVLEEMRTYAQTHFETEENYMIEFDYPEYQYHKDEHLDFISKIDAYDDSLIRADFHISNQAQEYIANEIRDYLSKWLIKHVMNTDKKYVDCFMYNGLTREAENQEKMEQEVNRRHTADRRNKMTRRISIEERRNRVSRRSGKEPREDH